MKRIAWCVLLFTMALRAQPSCSLRGIVVDAITNRLLSATRVFADLDSDPDDNSPLPVRQITDASGAFCFESLTDGNYVVRASRAYYIDASYGEHWSGGSSQILEVSAGQSGSLLTIKMAPQAVISGVLADADGDPLPDARIELVKRRWKERKLTTALIQRTTTDDEGRYRFAGLAAGTYFLRATPGAEHDGPPVRRQFLDQARQPFHQVEGKTYYRDSISFREATPIRVSAGQEIGNQVLTLRVSQARHVRGQVAPEILNTSSRALNLFEEDGDTSGTWLSIPIENDGHFLAEGLFPNRYQVRGAGIISKEIDLTQGDIDDLALESNQPVELQITVHWQGAPSRPVHSLALFNRTAELADEARSVSAQPVSENKFKVIVHPGQYEIGPGNEGGSPYFIKGLTIDEEPQPRNILDVKGGARRFVDLVLSSDLASVEGRVVGNGSAKAKVMLLIENESDPESFSTKWTSPNGKFQRTLLQPGTYRLYAFEEFRRDLWGDPELANLLAAKSIVLEVKEGQHRQVSVPLISQDDFETALRKANF